MPENPERFLVVPVRPGLLGMTAARLLPAEKKRIALGLAHEEEHR